MDKRCRACFRDDSFKAISVNAFSERHQEPINLMLIYCTQLQYSTNDTLPQQICPECLGLLDGAFTFWKQCRQTDANFRYVGGVIVEPVAVPEKATDSDTESSKVDSSLDESEKPSEQENFCQPVASVQEVPPVVPAETSSALQSFCCCFRKCPKVTTSLEKMEQHAKKHHYGARVAYEVQRAPDRTFVCSVCCAGFNSRGSLDWHLMIQLGARQKGRTSAIVRNKRQEQEKEEEKPKDDLEGVETTVVKEELDLDEWSMDKEESVVDFESEDVKIDECQDDPVDETTLEQERKALFDSLMIKLAEKFAKTQDHFQIPITRKEYLSLKDQSDILRKFRKAAFSRFKKRMRLMITCENCKFETNLSVQMQQHVKKSVCHPMTPSYALATYELSVQTFVCVSCDYKTNDSNAIHRHQLQLGHEGIDISRSEPATSKPVTGDEISSSSIQFDIVPVKDEPYLSEEDESLLEGGQEKFDCTLCGAEFLSDADKQRHMMCECAVLHKKDGRYTCEHCKVVSTQTVKELKMHMRTDCPALEGKTYKAKKVTPKQCHICQRIFNTSEGLDRHAVFCKAKNDRLKFICPNCGLVLKTKYNLSRHLQFRACLKDPNQCKNCFTKFADMTTLKLHRKVGCSALHSGIRKPCNCERCGKGFANRRLLRLHQIVDGCGGDEGLVRKPVEGKIQCPYCFTQLCRPSNLKRHLQKYCLVLLKKQVEAECATTTVAAQDTAVTNVLAETSSGTET